MKIIVKMKFGAHLYGTATPDSDVDYKGIFLPTKEELLLGRVPKSHNYSTGREESRNTKNDIDIELYSFYYLINQDWTPKLAETARAGKSSVNRNNAIENTG
jgi:predicted nucleotidyltransferase